MNGSTISLALEVLIQLTLQAQKISVLIQQATAESRDLTNEEFEAIATDANASRAALIQAIAKAKGEGR